MNKEMQSFNISRSGFHRHFALKSTVFHCFTEFLIYFPPQIISNSFVGFA